MSVSLNLFNIIIKQVILKILFIRNKGTIHIQNLVKIIIDVYTSNSNSFTFLRCCGTRGVEQGTLAGEVCMYISIKGIKFIKRFRYVFVMVLKQK